MHEKFSYHYFAEELPNWCLYLDFAILHQNLADETEARSHVGKLLLLAEEFLTEKERLCFVKDTKMHLYLDEEHIGLHKDFYFLSVTQHTIKRK